MVECQLPKLNVVGSIPISRSTLKPSETYYMPVNIGRNQHSAFWVLLPRQLGTGRFWMIRNKTFNKTFRPHEIHLNQANQDTVTPRNRVPACRTDIL